MASRKNSEKSSPRGVRIPGAAAPAPSAAATPPTSIPADAASLQKKLAPRRTLSGYSRLTWLYEELKAGKKWNKRTLAEHFEVSRSTLKRLLNVFRLDFQQELGFDPEKNTFYLLDPGKPLPHIPATEGELFTLLMAQEALGAPQDSLFGRSLQAAISKMAAAVDRKLGGRLAELRKSVCFRTLGGSTVHDALAFDTVAEAVAARRELFCDYRPLGKTKASGRRVRPRCLVRLDGTWYVLTRQVGSRRELTLALARMSNLRLGTETFPPEEGITLRQKLDTSIGIFGGTPQKVRLRLEGPAARVAAEQSLHSSHYITVIDEDTVELSLTVAVNAELERWILGWGDQMEVLDPPSLRQSIAARLQRAAARHAQPLPPRDEETPAAAAPPGPSAEADPAAVPAESVLSAASPEGNSPERDPTPLGDPPPEGSRANHRDSSRGPSEVLTTSSEGSRENLPKSSRPPRKVPSTTSKGPHDHLPRSS